MLAIFAASASGIAESFAHAQHNAWSKCRHTQQRIQRGKPCPCGCSKKARPALRITSDLADCDADDVVAHAPAFSGLDSLITTAERLAPTLSSVIHLVSSPAVNSLPPPPLTKPG
ncbi:MAG: hypothetical protein ACOY5B_15930 [Spirochaetota bacterium]